LGTSARESLPIHARNGREWGLENVRIAPAFGMTWLFLFGENSLKLHGHDLHSRGSSLSVACAPAHSE
jgi:hypothetical protein